MCVSLLNTVVIIVATKELCVYGYNFNQVRLIHLDLEVHSTTCWSLSTLHRASQLACACLLRSSLPTHFSSSPMYFCPYSLGTQRMSGARDLSGKVFPSLLRPLVYSSVY